MKLREGDQPLPTINDRPDIQSLVIRDIELRREVGIQRYGTALQAHNGRSAMRDAYEESLDQVFYLRQEMEERIDLEARIEELEAAVNEALSLGSTMSMKMDGSSEWRITRRDVNRVREILRAVQR